MFKRLTELLILSEAPPDEDFITPVKKAFAAVKTGVDAAKKSMADNASKASAAEKANMRKDFDAFVVDFFDNFPPEPVGQAQADELLKKYPSREGAALAYKMFNNVASRLDTLRNNMNKSLRNGKLISPDQVRQIERALTKTTMAPDTVQFVKAEATFFKRLVHVDNDFNLAEADFKTLLTAKMNQTANQKKYAAALELNLVFKALEDACKSRAEALAKVGRDRPAATPPKP